MGSLRNIILIVTIMAAIVVAQNLTSEGNYIRQPKSVAGGIVFTDNNYSAVYYFAQDSTRELIRLRNVGQYYSIAPQQNKLGVKLIDSNGQQTPVIIDIQTGELTRLHSAARQIGQVSFTADGRTAYTVGDNLVISDGRTIKLGYYANIAPISPDGNSVCFNDADDQLWLMNLETHSKIRISEAQGGYYRPQWSPDGNKILYSAFNGDAKIYEISTQTTYTIKSTDEPSWSDDSETIIFSRKEIENFQLINADIYTARFDGSSLTNITNTSDIIETDATFIDSGAEILYRIEGEQSIRRTALNNSKSALDQNKSGLIAPPNIVAEYTALGNEAVSVSMNVPYLHQVYDVPDWFWGYYACAPTTAAMLLAYYNILPVWNVTCSSPSTHTSRWGRYICEQYYYRETDYKWSSSPNGHTAGKGGYGYMWGNGSPNSYMGKYYQLHGLTTNQIWNSATWTVATNQINNGYPYTMCVRLTSSGHLVLAKGIVEGKHSLIFNDPYGDRNGSSYPAYNGNGVIYDWPGYNEGHANLAYAGTGIPWCIAAQYTVTSVSDTLVDDLNLAQGFTLNTDAPSSMTYWKDKNTGGFNDHFWYTNSRISDTCSAEWSAPVTSVGRYEVLAYIPTLNGLTANATYHIRTGAGDTAIVIDQNANQGNWASLGTHYFDVDHNCVVYLNDSTGQKGDTVAFDAIKWQYTAAPAVGLTFNSYTGDWDREGPPKTIFFQGQISYCPDYTRFHWDFGDGGTADLLNPEHVFRSAGNYTVSFTAIFGDESFSTDTVITIGAAAATDFALLIPENETTLTTATPLFYWIPPSLKDAISAKSQLLDGYKSFSFYLHHNTAFNEVQPIILDTNLYRPTEPLTENTEYFWTVVAEDTAGNKTLSPIWSFIVNTENSAPNQFALISPAEAEIVTELQPVFIWNTARDTDPGDEITYRLKVGTALNDLISYDTGVDTFFTMSIPLSDNTIYYWQIEAIDADGVITVNEGGCRTFCVNLANDPPSAVTLLTPQDGSLITTTYPLFLWSASEDADPHETLRYYLTYWRDDFNYIYQYQTDTTFCSKRKVLSNRVYHWLVITVDAAGDSAISDTFTFATGNVGLTENAKQPLEFALHQNYPNPFNPNTTIAFDLPQEAEVSLAIYDLMGREITTLVNGYRDAGCLNVEWNGTDKSGRMVASGIYLCILRTSSGQSAIRKMALIR